jgi:hypothetical protein
MIRSASASIFAAVFALLVTVTAFAPRPAHADDPAIYLTWNAPYGQPRASDTLSTTCDTTRTDTLWLAFDSGKASPKFLAVTATLYFHAAVGDSLSPFWGRDYNGKPRWLKIEAEPQPGLGYPQPYRTNGGGGWAYTREGDAGRLRFIYATPYSEAIGIKRNVYAAARMIFKRPPASEERCGQPICIEWAESEISFDITGPEHTFVRTGPHRFVSINSPGGEICVPYRKAASLHGWKPGE